MPDLFCTRLNVGFVYEVDQHSVGIELVSITYTGRSVCNVFYEGRMVNTFIIVICQQPATNGVYDEFCAVTGVGQ